jgi:hypothetical protein
MMKRRVAWSGCFMAATLALGEPVGRRVLEFTTILAAAPAQAPTGDLGFTVPPGYSQKRDGELLFLVPANPNQTPCVYGFAGRHLSTGNLETDAQAALVKIVVPGFRKLDDWHYAMRGTSAAGWSYFWYRGAFAGELNGQRANVNAMAMVLQAGPGQVHVVWGMGSIVNCLLDDATFEQLFHSLRPSAWTSDGGAALTRALMGTWRFTAGNAGMHQLTFRTGGRYARDLGSSAIVGAGERTSATATEGRFTLRDGELTLVPDNRPGDPDRKSVRVYEEYSRVGWKHAVVLLDNRAQPPSVVQYYRVEP